MAFEGEILCWEARMICLQYYNEEKFEASIGNCDNLSSLLLLHFFAIDGLIFIISKPMFAS